MAEDYTARGTCECCYQFKDASYLGKDKQGQVGSGTPVRLTNNGAVQSSDYPNGTYGSSSNKSADFESGDSDYMTTAHANAQEVDNLTAWTVCFWVKHETIQTTIVYGCMTDALYEGWVARRFYSSPDDILQGWFGTDMKNYNWNPTVDKWYFVAITYNPDNNRVTLYTGDEEVQVDEQAFKNIGEEVGDTDGDFWLGCLYGPTQYVDGKICEYTVFSDDLTLTELQEIQLNGIEGDRGGEDLIKIINETLQFNEGTLRPRVMARIINETEQTSEDILRRKAMSRILDETLQISEDKVRLTGLLRWIDETLQISEGIIRVRDLVRIIGETLQINEGIVTFRKMLRQIDETLQIQENIVRLKKMVRQIDETLQLSEAIGKVLGFVRVVDETLQISEGIVKLKGLIRWINETLQLNEGIVRTRNLVRLISETLSLQENIVRARTMLRIIGENISISEGSLTRKAIVKIINETVQLVEGIIKALVSTGVPLYSEKLLTAFLERSIQVKSFLERNLGLSAKKEKDSKLKATFKKTPKE